MRASAWQEPVLLPLVESRQPEFRNLLVTSRELVQHPLRARPAIRHKIFRDAALVVERTTLDTIVPSRDTTRAAAAAAVTALIAVTVWYGASLWATRDGAARTATATIERRARRLRRRRPPQPVCARSPQSSRRRPTPAGPRSP